VSLRMIKENIKEEIERIGLAYLTASYPEAVEIRRRIRGKILYWRKVWEKSGRKDKSAERHMRAWLDLYHRLNLPNTHKKKMRWL